MTLGTLMCPPLATCGHSMPHISWWSAWHAWPTMDMIKVVCTRCQPARTNQHCSCRVCASDLNDADAAQVAQLRGALRGMPDLERALGAARNAAAAPPTALPPAILATLQRK